MSQPRPSTQTLRALDAVNFLMADVETGVGPFLAIYLSTSRHWDAGQIGFAMSVCIVGAQAVMVPVALASGRLSSRWGRKAVFLIGFGILPLRGVLYTLSGNAYFLIGVQLLDGIGVGIFGVVSVLIIADLTRGTGRFNFTLGALATATGIGASLSNAIAGSIAKHAGFNTAFLFLAAVATVGFCVFLFAMPETKKT